MSEDFRQYLKQIFKGNKMGASAQVSKNPIRPDDWYEKAVFMLMSRNEGDYEAIDCDVKALLLQIILSHGYFKTYEAITGKKYDEKDHKGERQ